MSPLRSRQLIAERVAQINARNDRTVRRCDWLAEWAVAVATAAALAWALLAWLTPCDAGALCVAMVTPTRLSPWALLRREAAYLRLRVRTALRAWHLRHKLAAALFDEQVLEHDIERLPQQLQHTRRHIEALRADLAACGRKARTGE